MSGPTMRAVRVAAHGGLDQLHYGDVPRPTPGPREVLVAVHAAGMNHLDVWVRKGVPGHSFPLPLIPGSDAAGIVVECGPGVENRIGEEVIVAPAQSCGQCEQCLSGDDSLCREYSILGEHRDGTCAEFICVPVANLLPKPRDVPFTSAGCFALAALTAWTMLVRRARVTCGEQVLVVAGTSGVGSFAVQIAKLLGCNVIATAGGAEKTALLDELGADCTIDHNADDVAARVRELTKKRGVDVVVDHVGEATWQASLRSLARGGRLVTCGATTGPMVSLDLRWVFFKRLAILGSTMGSKGDLPRLVRWLAEGRLRPRVGSVVPFSRVADAQRQLEERTVAGKVVLVPDSLLKGRPS